MVVVLLLTRFEFKLKIQFWTDWSKVKDALFNGWQFIMNSRRALLKHLPLKIRDVPGSYNKQKRNCKTSLYLLLLFFFFRSEWIRWIRFGRMYLEIHWKNAKILRFLYHSCNMLLTIAFCNLLWEIWANLNNVADYSTLWL